MSAKAPPKFDTINDYFDKNDSGHFKFKGPVLNEEITDNDISNQLTDEIAQSLIDSVDSSHVGLLKDFYAPHRKEHISMLHRWASNEPVGDSNEDAYRKSIQGQTARMNLNKAFLKLNSLYRDYMEPGALERHLSMKKLFGGR